MAMNNTLIKLDKCSILFKFDSNAILVSWKYTIKFKEIEYNNDKFLSDLPKLDKPLSVKSLLL